MSTTRDAKLASRAAKDPNRPGEKCQAEPGAYVPIVNRRKCEGKGPCVAVCPVNVFEVGPIDEAEYQSMPIWIRLKLKIHGKKTAHVVSPDACLACGLCVVACPENAIVLEKQ